MKFIDLKFKEQVPINANKSYNQSKLLILNNRVKIGRDILESQFAKSLRCLSSKVIQIDRIRESITSLHDSYSIQILYRSLIEHYLVAFYVFLNVRIHRTDEVGEAYYDFYANSEYLKQLTYFLQLESLKRKERVKVDADILGKKFPDLSRLTQSEIQAYHAEANKFSNVKKIGEFLINNSHIEPRLNTLAVRMFDLLDQYNHLSSYVHGGPHAERERKELKSSNVIEEQLRRVIFYVNTLGMSSMLLLLLSLSYEKNDKYKSLFASIQALLVEKYSD